MASDPLQSLATPLVQNPPFLSHFAFDSSVNSWLFHEETIFCWPAWAQTTLLWSHAVQIKGARIYILTWTAPTADIPFSFLPFSSVRLAFSCVRSLQPSVVLSAKESFQFKLCRRILQHKGRHTSSLAIIHSLYPRLQTKRILNVWASW